MRTFFQLITCVALAGMPAAANAQTYNLDIDMVNTLNSTSWVFAGSFTFNNPHGNFKNVFVSDPAGVAFGAGTEGFRSMGESGNTLTFIDSYGASYGCGSCIFELVFNLDTPLGGSNKNIGISDVTFYQSANVTGIYSCGPNAPLPGLLICPVASLTKGHPDQPGAHPVSQASAPEPSAASLMLLGIAGLLGTRIMRKSRVAQPKRAAC